MSGTKKPETLIARLLRALSGLSQIAFGKKTGRNPVLIDQWEQGDTLPGEPDLKALAELGAGISRDDAGEHLELYETQRSAFRRSLDGAGALLDGLTAALIRYGASAVRRLLTLPAAESPPSPGDRADAEVRFAELRRLSRRARLAVVRLNEDYQGWALAQRCCEESEAEASRDLAGAAGWARLALAVAWRVRGPQGWRSRVRAYAMAHWMNILRVRGKLEAAEACLARWAKPLWEEGSDPYGLLDPGRLLDLEGSLRRAQRRFGEALALFERAEAVSHHPARVPIKKGFTYEVMGDYGRAVATLLAAGAGVEALGDPRLLYMHRFNLAVNYTHTGEYTGALELLQQVRATVLMRNDRIEACRILWLEGRILAGLGRRDGALRLLAEARQRFEQEEMTFDVALCLLEEAGLLLAAGRTREVKALTLELTGVFQSKGVHCEAQKALRLFQQAVETDAATAELARSLLAYLFLARHDEGKRFEA
jgi:tetratricopeptide (TPR) repeat protein